MSETQEVASRFGHPTDGRLIRQIVRIVKTDAILGPLPVGAQFEGLFAVALKRDVAVARTFRMLKRDHPGENPMCWTVEGSNAR